MKLPSTKLRGRILLGLLGLSLASGCALFQNPVEAAPMAISSYSDEQREQAILDTQKRIEELKAQKAKIEAQEAKKDMVKTEKPPENAISFAERIGNIIAEYDSKTLGVGSGDFSKFLPKEKDKTQQVATPPVQTTVVKPLPPSGLHNFDWRGTPLAQSVYAVAKAAGMGVVVNGDLKGTVYVSLHNSSCEEALDYLSRAFNFNWQREGNNVIITESDKMLQSEVLPVSYANKDKLKEELAALGISSGNIYANTETGTVSVTGTPYQLLEAKKRLQAIDHPVAQCLLLAQLIEINHGSSLNLGMSYSLPTYSHSGTTTGRTDTENFKGNWLEKLTFSSSSQASRELSKGHVIARPMVMALNGQEGNVEFGDQVPILTKTDTGSDTSITVTYQNVGTHLKMTPDINEKTGEITLKIDAEVSNISNWITDQSTRAPQIATRKATTSARLHSGQSFAIGGLMNASDLDNLSGIPGLMDLPILGPLFRIHTHSKSYAEVYILVTPYIVTEGFDPENVLKDGFEEKVKGLYSKNA